MLEYMYEWPKENGLRQIYKRRYVKTAASEPQDQYYSLHRIWYGTGINDE